MQLLKPCCLRWDNGETFVLNFWQRLQKSCGFCLSNRVWLGAKFYPFYFEMARKDKLRLWINPRAGQKGCGEERIGGRPMSREKTLSAELQHCQQAQCTFTSAVVPENMATRPTQLQMAIDLDLPKLWTAMTHWAAWLKQQAMARLLQCWLRHDRTVEKPGRALIHCLWFWKLVQLLRCGLIFLWFDNWDQYEKKRKVQEDRINDATKAAGRFVVTVEEEKKKREITCTVCQIERRDVVSVSAGIGAIKKAAPRRTHHFARALPRQWMAQTAASLATVWRVRSRPISCSMPATQ